MPPNEWKLWTLSEWNQALVSEVFFDSERIHLPISRINAPDRTLTKCVGVDAASNEVHRHFIAAFGSTATSVRKKFKWQSIYDEQTCDKDIPAAFAQVFLTLLAASADADSINIGQFRLRFAELFKSFDVNQLTFDELPRFWESIASWSVNRNKKIGDCRVLQLPNYGRENLIGYSKKLVFPTFNDERILQSILNPDNLDFDLVHKAILNNRNKKFSKSFLEEFEEFEKKLYRADLNLAYETPFWGAVRDLSWEMQKEISSQYGSYCIEASTDDLYHEFYLSTDRQGFKLLENSSLRIKAVSEVEDKFSIEIKPDKGLIGTLLEMRSKVGNLKSLRIWKQMQYGLIAFFPDNGYLTTNGTFSDGDRCSFYVSSKLFKEISYKPVYFSKRPEIHPGRDGGEGWTYISFDRLLYKELQQFLPQDVKSLIGAAWKPPQINLRGGAKYGQAYLINPSSNPRFESSKFASGNFQLLTADDRVLVSGTLQSIEGFLRIPPTALMDGLECARAIKYDAIGLEGNSPVNKIIPILNKSPKPNYLDFNDLNKWLVPGRAGQLIAYENLFFFKQDDLKIISSESPKPYLIKSNALSDLTQTKIVGVSGSLKPNYLKWLGETLSLRFQARSSLPYRELVAYTEDVSGVLNLKPWMLRNLLFLGGWLIGLEDRRFSSFVPHMGPRTISVIENNGYFLCRVVGMLNEAEENRLLGMLEPEESMSRLMDQNNFLSIGAIEVRLSNLVNVSKIIEYFKLTQINRESFGPPLSTKGVQFVNAPIEYLPYGESFKVLENNQWVIYDNSRSPFDGMLVRSDGYQKFRFWVFKGNHFYETNNELWAKMIRCSFKNIPLGTIFPNGECLITKQVSFLPDSFSRWWLHWGGGCISYLESGELYLSGNALDSIWSDLNLWIKHPSNISDKAILNSGLLRRNLALQSKYFKNDGRRLRGYKTRSSK